MRIAKCLFAAGIIAIGVLSLSTGDFEFAWQPLASWAGRTTLAYGAGAILVATGAGLLFRATAAWASRILFVFLVLWFLLKLLAAAGTPGIEVVYESAAETAVILAGAWTLFARIGQSRPAFPGHIGPLSWLTGDRGATAARILFGLWLLPMGLSHFFYAKQTHDLVPSWMPFRWQWVYLTGAGHIAAGLGSLTGIWRRAAAYCEAGMVAAFTLLIWVPTVITSPKRDNWGEFFISWTFGAAAFVIAQDLSSCNQNGSAPGRSE